MKNQYALSVSLLIALCLIAPMDSRSDRHETPPVTPTEPDTGDIDTQAPARIRAVPLGEVLKRAKRSAAARVVSLNQSKIAAEISARVLSIDVKVGESVSRGQLLARLDCSDYDRARAESSARLDANRSRLKLAEQQLERVSKLVKSKSISDDALDRSQAEYDSAQAEIAAQRASLERLQNQASRCLILAPYAGIVSQRIGQIGEFSVPGSELVELVDTINVELSAQIPDLDTESMQKIKQGEFVYAGQRYPVKIRSMLPIIDNVTRSRETRLRFIKDPPSVGSAGRLVWTISESALPADLISQRHGEFGVLTVVGNHARFIVIPNAVEGRPAIVGLGPDTLIVTEGRQGLEDGDVVSVAE